MCCPAHYVRLPPDLQISLLFPATTEDDQWPAYYDEIVSWAIDVGLQPVASKLAVAIRENIRQRQIHTRRAIADGMDAWLIEHR